MAQPTPYTRQTDFSTDESGLVAGRSTVRTARVDAELDALGLTANETRVNLGIIQRDDTKLRDGAVELHTLAADVRALLATTAANPRGAWLTATAYAVGDLVTQSTNTYLCAVAHTSGTFATDLTAVRWLLVAQGDAFSVKRFGAVGDGTTDDTAAIQAAIDYVGAAGGGVVFFPAGSYFVSDTIDINYDEVFLLGSGMYNTFITRSGNFGDTFAFGGSRVVAGTELVHTGVSDMSFTSTGLTTSGAHLRYSGVTRHAAKNIGIFDGFIGIQAGALTAATFDNIYLVFTNLFGGSATGRQYLYMTADLPYTAHPHCGDVFFSNFNFRGNIANTVTAYGINIECSDGVWFSNGHVGNTTVANIRIAAATATYACDLLFFSNVMSDEGLGASCLFTGATTTSTNIQLVNCTFKGGGTCVEGLWTQVGAQISNVQVSNCSFSEFTQRGVFIASTAASNFSFSNCQVRGNSFTSAGAFPGMLLTDCRKVQITGGSYGGHNTDPYGTRTQSYGILAETGVSDIVIDGVDVRGNATEGLGVNAAVFAQVSYDGIVSDVSSTIASAANISLTRYFNVFTITGTTNITGITANRPNSSVTLVFTGVLTVTDGGNLKLNGNLVTAANTTLSLICDGTNWIEISRSVN